jgi:hypothetical protein
VHHRFPRWQRQGGMAFLQTFVEARGSRKCQIQRRRIAVLQLYLAGSHHLDQVVVEQPRQAQMLVWLAHWLAHLQRGNLRLAIVVSVLSFRVGCCCANFDADDESDKDDW